MKKIKNPLKISGPIFYQILAMRLIKFATAILFLTLSSASAQEIPKRATDISPLLIGEKIPDIELRDINGTRVRLRKLATEKEMILIFYRGGWCPYCNLHLQDLQSVEADILNAGYQIIAISADSPEKLKVSIDKNKLNYTLLSDADTRAAQSFGLAYQAPEKYRNMLDQYSDELNKGILPVPAVFVLDKQGEILFEHISPDYTKRIKGSLLLAVIKEIKD